MKRGVQAILLSLLLFTVHTTAAELNDAPSAADNDKKFEALIAPALQMFAACHYMDILDVYVEQREYAFVDRFSIDHRDWSKDELNQFTENFRTIVRSRKSNYVNRQAMEYAGSFSAEELGAMTAFCRTPLGDSYSRKRVELVAKTNYLDGLFLEHLVETAAVDAINDGPARKGP